MNKIFLPMRYLTLPLILILACGTASASTVPTEVDTLKASVVRGERSAKSIVREASRDFSKNYADYYAPFQIVRTIKSNGSYREVQCAVGVFASLGFNQKSTTKLYWDDRNVMGRLYVCDTFVSESLFPNKNEVNPVLKVTSNGIKKDDDALKSNYVDEFDVSALDRKRAVEIFSPLNPKMIGNYTYKSAGTSKVNGSDVRVIDFISNSKTITVKERIHCSGQLFIDFSGRIRKIVVKDMDERFTRYIRNFSEMSLATPYTYTITYGDKKGKIYTSSISQELSWRKPDDAAMSLYSAECNPCRNPFRNRVETSFVMKFSEPRTVNAEGEIGEAGPAYSIKCYNESRDYDFWSRIISDEIDLEKFMKDTGSTWDSLCSQTVTRQERELAYLLGGETKVEKEKERLTAKTVKARELFRSLFGKDYTECF